MNKLYIGEYFRYQIMISEIFMKKFKNIVATFFIYDTSIYKRELTDTEEETPWYSAA